ncbi:MAG: NAD-dependent epimerase/dehydratase family protein [Alphaproteobacteria bacterium]|nr:MAG: NAD-dependent epimerase/dehydratase family protein [Alphaproteobacteria bacterium]
MQQRGWSMANLLLIGATSSLGARLCADLATRHSVRTVGRRGNVNVLVKDYRTVPASAFDQIDVLVNCVGTHAGSVDTLHQVNVEVPRELARQARAAGVGQIVHFSSLKVYGYEERIDETTKPRPNTEYGHSKLRGENALVEEAGPEITVSIVRPPAIYGGGSGSNIARLVRFMARRGFFVAPYGDVRRSFANIENMAPVVEQLIAARSPGVTLVADRGEMTLAGLARLVQKIARRRIRVYCVPRQFLLPLRILSRSLYNSLFESQIVTPTFQNVGKSLEDGLLEFVRSLLQEQELKF